MSGTYKCRGNIIVFIPSAAAAAGNKIFVFNGMDNPINMETTAVKIFAVYDNIYEARATAALPVYIPAPGLSVSLGPTITPNFLNAVGAISFQITHAKQIPSGGTIIITLPAIAPFTTSAYNVYALTGVSLPANLGVKFPLTVSKASNVITLTLSKSYFGNNGAIDLIIEGPLQTSIAAATITVKSQFEGKDIMSLAAAVTLPAMVKD